MSNLEIFITNPINISSKSLYPRNYNPNFLLVKDGMKDNPTVKNYIAGDIKGGSTPPAYLFTTEDKGIPFIKTAAVTRHFINVNDLQSINEKFHRTSIKRSITRPYDVIYTMTGKFMGKAAMCPCTIFHIPISADDRRVYLSCRLLISLQWHRVLFHPLSDGIFFGQLLLLFRQ